MSQIQAAANARAIAALAETFTHWALPEPERRAETVALQLLADGLAPMPRPERIPPRGNGGSPAARSAALEAAAQAVAAAKARRESPQAPQPMASPRQLTRLAILLSEDGIRERPDRLAWCGAMVGRDLVSTSELTHAEAHRLIESIATPAEAPAVEAPPDEQDATPEEALADYRAGVALAEIFGDDPDRDEDDDGDGDGDGDGDEWLDDLDEADLPEADDEQPTYAYAGGPDDPPF